MRTREASETLNIGRSIFYFRERQESLPAHDVIHGTQILQSIFSTVWACFEKTDDEIGVIWLVVLVFEVNGRKIPERAVETAAVVKLGVRRSGGHRYKKTWKH